MDLSATLQLLKDRRDALNVTIMVLEDEQSRHARAAKNTKRALREFTGFSAPAVNGHAPGELKRGDRETRVLSVLSSHPLLLAEIVEQSGVPKDSATGALSRMRNKRLVVHTKKGWVKKP